LVFCQCFAGRIKYRNRQFGGGVSLFFGASTETEYAEKEETTKETADITDSFVYRELTGFIVFFPHG
jgi:hypothetical protein